MRIDKVTIDWYDDKGEPMNWDDIVARQKTSGEIALEINEDAMPYPKMPGYAAMEMTTARSSKTHVISYSALMVIGEALAPYTDHAQEQMEKYLDLKRLYDELVEKVNQLCETANIS